MSTLANLAPSVYLDSLHAVSLFQTEEEGDWKALASSWCQRKTGRPVSPKRISPRFQFIQRKKRASFSLFDVYEWLQLTGSNQLGSETGKKRAPSSFPPKKDERPYEVTNGWVEPIVIQILLGKIRVQRFLCTH